MLLVYKYHSVLILNVHTDEEGYVFRAYIPEHLMADYAIWCRGQGIMVRCM
jgi:hypothetical protein